MTQTPLSPHDAKQYSPLSLAFLGDSVFDTLIREQLLRTANQPPAALHQKKVALVCAGFQATVMRELLPTLTKEEQAVFLRGRNAAPKHAHQAEYRYATGLEALFGYLYLTGAADRMQKLMQQILMEKHTLDLAGTGIGIQNVVTRLRMYYGEELSVVLESEPEKGTKFTFWLPIPENPEKDIE